MTTRLLLASALVGLLVSCGAPRTSQAYIDTDGDGLAESVRALNSARDQEVVLLHLQRIESSRKLCEIAERAHAVVESRHAAGRASSQELLTSRLQVMRADIDLVDARLALARTAILPTSEPTMLDTDGDGLPDLHYSPVPVEDLLQRKVDLSHEVFEQTKVGYAHAETMHGTGTVSADVLHVAARDMHEAELAWIDARMERDTVR